MWRSGKSVERGERAALLVLTALLSISAARHATADDQAPLAVAPPQAAAPSPSPPVQPPPMADRSDFLHELGAWWTGSFGNFDTKMRNAFGQLDGLDRQRDQAIKDAAQATGDAATAVVRLPTSRVFELRDRCRTAGNGAPDCQTSAADVCRGKGFKDGRPLDVSTQQECPARVMMSGQPPADGACIDKTFLLRVICQ
jgi:hypothetical protein